MIGIAIGTALLPMLSRTLAQAAHDPAAVQRARDTQNRAIEFGMLLALPAGVALAAIPEPILTVLLERGAFAAPQTSATAAALAAYAAGVPAYIVVKVLQTAFHARQDTGRPVLFASASVAVNIVLSLLLIRWLGHVGIALATALAAWVNAGLLAGWLQRHGALEVDDRLRRRLPRLVVAAAAMGLGLLGGRTVLAPWFDATLPVQVCGLALLVGGGAALYFGVGQALGAFDWRELRSAFRRRRDPPGRADGRANGGADGQPSDPPS